MSENHGPNTNHSGWMQGRHWAVMFRCTRCKRVETVEYRREGNDGNLQCQQAPDDWLTVGGMLLCDSCGHRIPTKAHSESYQPKYPFCPWCGAKVLNGRYVRRDA